MNGIFLPPEYLGSIPRDVKDSNWKKGMDNKLLKCPWLKSYYVALAQDIDDGEEKENQQKDEEGGDVDRPPDTRQESQAVEPLNSLEQVRIWRILTYIIEYMTRQYQNIKLQF